MGVTPDSPLVGPPSGTLSRAIAYLGTDTAEYLRELWRLCELTGLDPAIMAAQMAHETADGTSHWWVTRRNPAGIGITGDPAQNAASQTWTTQTDAARGHVVHMLAYVKAPAQVAGDVLAQLATEPGVYDRRWLEPSRAGYRARTIRDLTGRWAVDPDYHTKIAAKHRAMFGAGEEEQPVATPPTIDYSPLPVPVIVDLIGEDQPNQNPGIPMTPKVGTWHETANQAPGADALMHARYLRNGADGSQVSWHFTVDDERIVQHMPLNRVAWHAGDGSGPGNYTSIAVECCVNRDGDLAMAQTNTAALFGLLRAKGIIGEVFQHNHWSGKDCPTQLRRGNTMTWAQAQAYIAAFAKQYGEPVKPKPAPIWWKRGDVGRVVRASDGWVALAMLVPTYATTKRDVPLYDQIGGVKVGTIKAGKPVVVVGTTRDLTGKGWFLIETPDGFARARGSSFADKLPLP